MNPYTNMNETLAYWGTSQARASCDYGSTADETELSSIMTQAPLVFDYRSVPINLSADAVFSPIPPLFFVAEISIAYLSEPDMSVVRPIPVSVEREGDEIRAEIPELELYAFGSSTEEAVEELREEVADLVRTLASLGDDQLGGKASAWKKFLSSRVRTDAG